MKRDI
jgi:hypothetical protein